jgi:hypothetical protein
MKPSLSPTTKKTRPCTRFVGGDNQHGAFRGEQLRFPCKLRRYICARCGMRRGEHHHAGVSEELLPPRKRSAFRRLLVRFKARKEKKRERVPGIWHRAAREVVKGERGGPRRQRANVMCVDWLWD